MNQPESNLRQFRLKVLGRTLEHLGVQMYKRRDVAIAELVANCWDAGATDVRIEVPEEGDYDPATNQITITDNGSGMAADDIQDHYLVVGRNRRKLDGVQSHGRALMGRKGIGKLAGFGVASRMVILTWREASAIRLALDVSKLTLEDGVADDVVIQGFVVSRPQAIHYPTGTQIVLEELKHKTPLPVDLLREALARRFSRTVRGIMSISVNSVALADPTIELESRFPENSGEALDQLSDEASVSYWYGFATEPIKSPQLRGFTIHVNGKTAQAPPYFFNVEGTASGQHGTRYMTGVIEADYLDFGSDNETDRISTDRQEIDWEDPAVEPLRSWGDALTRKALREWAKRKGEKMKERVFDDSTLRPRIERMEPSTQKKIVSFLETLGQAEPEPQRGLELAEALIRAYEYRQFHDYISQIEELGEDPEELHKLLSYLSEWKVLESRAILEIIKGRLDVVRKFHQMIVNDAPETAPRIGEDNMHDLIAGYPWLLNPEWQTLSEEQSITAQLREWSANDIPDPNERERYDFLALTGDKRLVVVEIKRAGHAVEFEELQRLNRYKERLLRGRSDVFMLLIYGGTLNVSDVEEKNWNDRPDAELAKWNELHERTNTYYEHYRAVLEGAIDHPDFDKKLREVAQTRRVLESGGSYRDKEARKQGLGPQDIDIEQRNES